MTRRGPYQAHAPKLTKLSARLLGWELKRTRKDIPPEGAFTAADPQKMIPRYHEYDEKGAVSGGCS